METFTGILDYQEVNQSFEIGIFLDLYNSSISRRYNEEKDANEHQVYQVSEFANLSNEQSFTEPEKEIALRLSYMDGYERGGELVGAIEKYFSDSLRDGSHNSKELQSSEPIAKLRRTLAILYKNAQIPYLDLHQGGFKEVIGPIGTDKSKRRPVTQKIIGLVGPIWKWDGNLPDVDINHLEINNKRERQWALVRSKKEDFKPKNDTELEVLEELSGALDFPPYFPEIYQKINNGRYVENIPISFPSGSFDTRIKDVIQVSKDLQDLWQIGGVILTDIKADNFKKRENGEVVIIDFGSRQIDTPATSSFSVSDSEFTASFTAPEYALYLMFNEDDHLKTEPFIVYQIGVMLLESIYEPQEYIASLRNKKGYVWEVPETNSRGSTRTCSISSDTLLDLLATRPNKHVPNPIQQILTLMLDEKPFNRPTINQVVKTLEHYLNSSIDQTVSK